MEDALNLGAVNFLHKPIKAAEFRFVVNRIARLLEEEENVQEALESITERSTQMSHPLQPGPPAARRRLPGPRGPPALPGSSRPASRHQARAVRGAGQRRGARQPRDRLGRQGRGPAPTPTGCATWSPCGAPRRPTRDAWSTCRSCYRPEEVEYRIRDEGQGFDPDGYDSARALSDTETAARSRARADPSLHGRGQLERRRARDPDGPQHPCVPPIAQPPVRGPGRQPRRRAPMIGLVASGR